MERSAHQANPYSRICRVVFIATFALVINVMLVEGQARGIGHGGMGGRVAPRGGFAPHRGFGRASGFGFGTGSGTPLTGFCDRSPFCVTGAAASGLPYSPFFGAGFWGFGGGWGGFDGGWGYPSSYDGAEYDNFQQQIAQYIGSLGQQVQKLREDAERSRYEAPPKPPAEPKIINVSFAGTRPSESVPPAVFVLKNGQKIETTRYVLTADTLSVQRIGEPGQIIPVSELNVAATATANRERGLTFNFPRNRSEIFLGF